MPEKILLVDDEPNLLVALKRVLYRDYDILTAASGEEALKVIAAQGATLAVVVSDFRMPGMDGIQFLARVRALSREVVRVLFTGHADVNAAMDAINEGGIFRLLLKPSRPEQIATVLQASVEQHRLIVAERELLEDTLKGAVQVLSDILAAVSPLAFSRSARVKELCTHLAPAIGVVLSWEMEVSALLSQIGCVTIPPGLLERRLSGASLTPDEERLLATQASIGSRLLAHIPRLEVVEKAIALQEVPYSPNDTGPGLHPEGDNIPPIARLLKVALDYDLLLASGKSPKAAFEGMSDGLWRYDPRILKRLEELVHRADVPLGVRQVNLSELAVGMVLADDVRDRNGMLLISSGHRLTEVLVFKLRAFALTNTIDGNLRVRE
ncbi:MAG: response regulator [Deltaproteobacteria bacterium]|nr:response regulator [Deltaproteobacteria bacterium]